MGSDLQHCDFAQAKAEECLDQGRFREAIEGFAQALRLQITVRGSCWKVLAKYKSISRKLVHQLKMTHGSSEPTLYVSYCLQFEKVLGLFEQGQVAWELCLLYGEIAACYRQLTNFELSQQFLHKALKIANAYPQAEVSRASLCISMCSTLSAAKEYSEARKYGKLSLAYAQEELQRSPSNTDQVVALVAVGHHNVAVQEEKLGRKEKALEEYRRAVTFLETNGTEKHFSLLADLRKSLKDARLSARQHDTTLPLLHSSACNSPRSSSRQRSTSRSRGTSQTPSVSQRMSPSVHFEARMTAANRSFQPSVASSPRGESEETRVGSAAVSLEQTLEKPRIIRVRGRKLRSATQRPPAGPVCPSENTTKSEDIPWQKESSEPRIELAEALKISLKKSKPPLDAIRLIQAFLRGCLVRRRFALLKAHSRQPKSLLARRGKRFKSGAYAIISVFEAETTIDIYAYEQISGHSAHLTVGKPLKAPVDSLVDSLEFSRDKELVLVDRERAAIQIQKVVKGFLARAKYDREKPERLSISAFRTVTFCPPQSCPSSDWELLSTESVEVRRSIKLPVSATEIQHLSTSHTLSVAQDDYAESSEFRLAAQGLLELKPGTEFAVMVYCNDREVWVKAFPQSKKTPIPKDFVVGKSRLGSFTDEQQLLRSVRLSASNALELVFSTTADLHRAATLIQSSFRMYRAKRQRHLLSRRKLLYRGFKSQIPAALYRVFVFLDYDRIDIQAKNERSAETLRLLLGPKDWEELEINQASGCDIFSRLYVADGCLRLAPTVSRQVSAAVRIQRLIRGAQGRRQFRDLQKKAKRKLQFVSSKTADAEEIRIAIYELADKVQIESFKVFTQRHLKYRSQTMCFTYAELKKMYGKVPTAREIFGDLVVSNAAVVLRPRLRLELEALSPASLKRQQPDSAQKVHDHRAVIRTSQKIEEQLWVITMTEDHGTLEFTAFASSYGEPLRTRVSLEEIALKTRLPQSFIYPIGTITIKRLLRIEKGNLFVDFSAPVPDISKLATLIQAYARGYLVRRRNTVKPAKSNLVTCQVITSEGVQWVLYAYRSPPKIIIQAVKRHTGEVVEVLQIKDAIFRNFPPSISNKRIIESFVFPKLSIDTVERKFRTSKSITNQIILEKHKDKIKMIAGSSPCISPRKKAGQAKPVSPFPIAITSPVRVSQVRKLLSQEDEEALLARYNESLESEDEPLPTKENSCKLKDWLAEDGEPRGESRESRRGDAATQGYQTTDNEGQRSQESDRVEVLYKRNHYISNRLFNVTISRVPAGIRVEAWDPTTKSTLVLPVSTHLEPTPTAQISVIVSHLQVSDIGGQDTLSLRQH